MEKKEFIVADGEKGTRLDLFLASREPAYSRSYWQKLCRQGYVFLDGSKQLKPGTSIKEGQKIEVFIPPPEEVVAQPEEIPLDIVYEDEDLLVVNKPKGMVVHPAAGHRGGTLVNALLAHCKDLLAIGDKLRPGIVHRLDKDTSGLLVVAKNEPAFRHLVLQLKERKMKREYLALVHGSPPREKGTIDAPIGRDPLERKKFTVRLDESGRRAVTHYRILKKLGRFSLLSLQLETGRTHQIRVHLAYLSCPVVGDPVYGPKRSPFKNMGQLLHAKTLGFLHPRRGEYMEFTVEPGKDFLEFLKRGEDGDSWSKTDHGWGWNAAGADPHCPRDSGKK